MSTLCRHLNQVTIELSNLRVTNQIAQFTVAVFYYIGTSFFMSVHPLPTHSRRSLQYHYASSECQFIKCPKENDDQPMSAPNPQPGPEGAKYFDCDPSCSEKKYYYYPKGEMLVTGRDYGENYI